MNYGTTLMVMAIINVLVIFSGFPTGWKQAIIIVTALVMLAIGAMLRAISQKRAKRMRAAVTAIEMTERENLSKVADEIAHDITEQVEEEIDHITEATEHYHFPKR